MKIGIKDDRELKLMRESGRILGIILHKLEKMIAPGISCLDLDREAARLMKKFNVKPSFKGYGGFPANICTNVNDQVVHGIPGAAILKEGDIITIDCGINYEGFHSDSAIQVGVGKIDEKTKKFLLTAEKALYKAIDMARPGVRIGKISAVIQSTVEKKGYSVVRELVGHGIGKSVHEDPPVPNFKDHDPGPVLRPGMTIAIEPIICMGKRDIKLARDGWTYVTKDGSLSTQVEHTIAITEKGSEILTKRPKS
ncbi:type I methionyl aminopeptidase [Patescibacteria group bacterium]|nr:type I methionyl aminopeptidase [Patescibacteria group bacterium]MBU1703526.1 type I methionyl aminopeptidase [Patescibacteria group bacterium]MBU1953433.1 type I methionyl aminopeptidase [Patescibacteria group bacterium]